MSGTPTVSVALCTYNGAHHVADQVSSILHQTVPPDELVVSDDGSTDETLDIIRATVEGIDAPTAVRIIRNPGEAGVTSNFENAVRACGGDIIALSDQDDVWRPDRLRTMLDHLAGHPHASLAFSDARLVDSAGTPLGATLFDWLEISGRELHDLTTGSAFSSLLRRNLVTGATVVFRRPLLDTALPFAAEWVHDEWLAILAAAQGQITVIREPLIDYRQHGSNQIGVTTPTLRHKMRRMLQPRADRNRTLARRAAALADRLDSMPVPADVRQEARAKARFETERATLPAARLLRILPVLRLASAGGYSRYASQGRADVMRDLVQPA